MKKRLLLYLHTHWDREWYWAFERYRMQLLKVVKDVVLGLEDGSIPYFHLDGQACALDDFIELEPAFSERIRTLVQSGRLLIGPWYILNDQMLVSGESMIRNLEFGMERARHYGNPMMVGYCPDTFGHSQDLPRILRGFGIETAVVWRGVPVLEDGPQFIWQSPDGSEVTALLLPRGYHHTFVHEGELKDGDGPRQIAEQLNNWLSNDVFSKLTEAAIVPTGGDHVGPLIGACRTLEAVQKQSAAPQAVLLEYTSLPRYLGELKEASSRPAVPIRLIQGELRENISAKEHGSAYMLAGVLSTRLYLKRQNRLAEHRLSKICEPLFSLATIAGLTDYPEAAIKSAWRYLLRNQPHDSICGCSVDEVHREMMSRYASLNQVLDIAEQSIRQRMLSKSNDERHMRSAALCRNILDLVDPDIEIAGIGVFNFSGHTASTPVRVRLAMPPGTDRETAERHLTGLLGEPDDVQILSVAEDMHLFAATGGIPDYKNVTVVDALVYARNLPALGLGTIEFREAVGSSVKTISTCSAPVVVHDRGISNGIYSLSISSAGKLIVTAQDGSGSQIFELEHQIADVADAGDSYNFAPIIDDKPIYARLKSVEQGFPGPLCGSLELTYEIDIPEGIVEDEDSAVFNHLQESENLVRFERSPTKIKHEIKTTVSLKRGVPIVFFESEWNNLAADHRLQVCFNTGAPVKTTWSENHFSLVERTMGTHEIKLPVPKATEAPLDRFPCQRFFIANNQLFLNTGLPEYGVSGSNVELTILRAISMLSRKRLLTRGGGAGPYMPVPEGNCPGTNKVNYGWAALSCLRFHDLDGAGHQPLLSEQAASKSPTQAETRSGSSAPAAPVSRSLSADPQAARVKAEHVSDEQANRQPNGLSAPAAPGKAEQISDEQRALAYHLASLFEGTHWATPVTHAALQGMAAMQAMPGSNKVSPALPGAGCEQPPAVVHTEVGSKQSPAVVHTEMGSKQSPASSANQQFCLIEIDNKHIVLTSFYSRDAGESFVLRLLNCSDSPQEASLTLRSLAANQKLNAERVDLNGASLMDEAKKFESVCGTTDSKTLESTTYKMHFGKNELITLSIKHR